MKAKDVDVGMIISGSQVVYASDVRRCYSFEPEPEQRRIALADGREAVFDWEHDVGPNGWTS